MGGRSQGPSVRDGEGAEDLESPQESPVLLVHWLPALYCQQDHPGAQETDGEAADGWETTPARESELVNVVNLLASEVKCGRGPR
jgi:hypothetical protein